MTTDETTAHDRAEHLIGFLRKLANDEHPYGTGPFDADHVKIFADEARVLLRALAAAPDVTTDRAELARLQDEVTELGNKLVTAAQAIERVRALHNRYDDGSCWECGQDFPCSTVRALDGDTTEEKR